MGKYLKITLTILAIAALGYGFGRFTAPSKIIETEKIRNVEVVVEKIVEIEKEVIKEVTVENKNVNTKTTITEFPDGRKETVITVVDISTIGTEKDTKKDTERDTEKDSESTTETDKKKITINKKAQWKFTALVGFEIGNFTAPVYGGLIEKRILGPIHAGVWVLSSETVGVGLSFEF